MLLQHAATVASPSGPITPAIPAAAVTTAALAAASLTAAVAAAAQPAAAQPAAAQPAAAVPAAAPRPLRRHVPGSAPLRQRQSLRRRRRRQPDVLLRLWN